MTRHRKGLRPLSQTGFHHIPRNPNQRVRGEGGTVEPRTKLSDFNEKQGGRQLHPTKGWRGLSVKRGRAQMLMAEVMNGQGRHLRLQARFLAEGY